MKKTFAVFAAGAAFCSGLLAAQEEADFLNLLEEAGSIATKSKLNIDQQPSVVSVIRRKDLERLGVLTLHQALELLPGLEAATAGNGWKTAIVRGVNNPNSYGSDKVKLLIDGVSVNNQLYQTVFYYLDFPAELIERIEVLRGPASALYGAGAYSGAINVVTRAKTGHQDQMLFAGAGSSGALRGGGLFRNRTGELEISGDFYYRKDDTRVDYPDTDDPSLQGFKDWGAGLNLAWREWSLAARIKRGEYENPVAYDSVPEPREGRTNKNGVFFLEAGFAPEIGGVETAFKAGLHRYGLDRDSTFADGESYAGEIKNEVADVYGISPDQLPGELTALIDAKTAADKVLGLYAREETRYLDASASAAAGNHALTAGLFHSRSRILESYVSQNYDYDRIADTLLNGNDHDWGSVEEYTGETKGFVPEGAAREVTALYLQDRVPLGSRTDLTGGLRYDHTVGFDGQYSGRLGLVWRPDGETSYKLMAGRAFRAPSWVELYSQTAGDNIRPGNPDLKPETIETYEAAFVRKPGPETTLRLNVYYSRLHDVIDAGLDEYDPRCTEAGTYGKTTDDCRMYANYDLRTSMGAEGEYARRLTPSQSLLVNASLLYAYGDGIQPYDYIADDPEMVNVAELMANLVHIYEEGPWGVTTTVKYLGDRKQNNQTTPGYDNRTLPAEITIDETVAYAAGSWRTALAVRNLFNAETRRPTDWNFSPGGLPTAGRSFALTVRRFF